MAKGCKKCDPHEICEECPEWIFTLADLIMCMMGLFVILWVLKPGGAPTVSSPQVQENTQRFHEVIGEIRAGFGYVPDPNSGDPVDKAMIEKMRLVGEGEKGTQQIKQESSEGTDPMVQNVRESKMAAVGTKIDFDPADAKLDDADLKALAQIAKDIRGSTFIVIVKGHASRDDFAENAPAQQFMDIAIRRAQAAADYLVSQGVSPSILRVQGCSTFEPISQNAYTRQAQSVNRRVEVYSTDLIVRDLQDPNRVSTTPLN